MDSRAIGVFDSGIGGLTVVKEIMDLLPNENIIYFGDTARLPYGSKSRITITKCTFQCINFLLEQDVKAVVIACNTASASSLVDAQDTYDIPIIGVVDPGALAACKATRTKDIGIIGTEGTVGSGAYEKAISSIDKDVRLFLKACPLFVPIVEEGWQNTEIAKLAAREYLEIFKKQEVDAIVMACTHYPLLEETIKNIVGAEISLINPAHETAKALKELLETYNISSNKETNEHRFFVSDSPNKFKNLGEQFLKKNINKVEKIDIERY